MSIIPTVDIKDGATSLLDLDYTYDNNNNITQLVNGWRDTSSSWHSETESYSYDGLDRLTSGSCTSWSHTYSYDRAGNRTGKDAITYTVNSVNEVTALSDGTSFTYDDNGNRIQKTKGTDTWDYTYDYANKLTKVEENDSTIGEYVYDGDGKRLQKTENSTTTTFMYSGINPMYEENSTGSACYIYGPTGLITKRTTIDQETNTYFYHKDHLGSTRLVTNSSKDIIATSTYHPFGETEVEEGSEKYLYNGKEKDSTGLYYYGARYYDPQIGRFTSRDPLSNGSTSGSNRYAYCQNNPLRFIDPTGLQGMETFHCAYVILPDGTISYELAEIFNKLQDALSQMSEDDWDSLNNLLAEDNTKIDAVSKLLDMIGIKHDVNELTQEIFMTLGEGYTLTIEFSDLPDNTWGLTTHGEERKRLHIFLNNKIKKAGDLFLTLGHELIHAYTLRYHGTLVDSIEKEGGEMAREVFMELIAFKWQAEICWKVPLTYVSPTHVGGTPGLLQNYNLLWKAIWGDYTWY